MKVNKQHNRSIPCPYSKQLESTHPDKTSKPQLFGYTQACVLLQAIELNRRKRLSKKCLAHLALYVSQAWEDKPCQEKIQQLYYMMNNLLDTTSMDMNEPFDVSLQKFCSNPLSTPTICPSFTLLIAISYVERLNKRYRNLKGTAGCGSRMIMVAFIMASKYIHESLKLIIYTGSSRSILEQQQQQQQQQSYSLITPPTSPKILNNNNNNTTSLIPPTEEKERNERIARMEKEFMFFLNYDLSIQDPTLLVKWAQSYENPETDDNTEEEYTSADEGDDEMDDEEQY